MFQMEEEMFEEQNLLKIEQKILQKGQKMFSNKNRVQSKMIIA